MNFGHWEPSSLWVGGLSGLLEIDLRKCVHQVPGLDTPNSTRQGCRNGFASRKQAIAADPPIPLRRPSPNSIKKQLCFFTFSKLCARTTYWVARLRRRHCQ